jgi:hypothetical protein
MPAMRTFNLRRLAVASIVPSTIDASFGGRVGEEHMSQFRGEATPVSL